MSSDPVPSSAISDATVGGVSLIVITGGSTGQVLMLQSDGTYAPATVSAGIGGSVGSTDNRLVRSDGTGGSTVQSTGITVDDSNNVSGVGTLGCGAITSTGNSSINGLTINNGNASNIGLDVRPWVYLRNNSGTLTGYVAAGASIFGSGASGETDFGFRAVGAFGVSTNNSVTPTLVITTGGIASFSGPVSAGTYTVATLPSASANAYKFATVSDSSVTTFGSTVAGSGSSKVMVYSNGTNWTVCAA